MITKDVFYRTHWQARIYAEGLKESEAITLSEKKETTYTDAIVWTKRIEFGAENNVAELTGNLTEATTTTQPVLHQELATITAAAGCTSNGNLDLVISGMGITGSPLTVPVALTTTAHSTAASIAQACRAALSATAAITALYHVSGLGPEIRLVQKRGNTPADTSSLNIAIPGARGVTAAANSTATTLSQLGTVLTNADLVDALGKPLPTSIGGFHFVEITVLSGAVAMTSALQGTMNLETGNVIKLSNPGDILFIAGSASVVDLVFMAHL